MCEKCLYCYKPLTDGEVGFHRTCASKFFGSADVPQLDYKMSEIDTLASQIIEVQTSITGVQPKLSLHLERHNGGHRLTIVGLWGAYIMKPQTAQYGQLPENEDITMHLAEKAGISTVPHSLMRMSDNSVCYLSRRVDRTHKGEKLAMEDLCQLSERQTEYKYKSSYEKVGKTIARYSAAPMLDVTNFFEVVLFSYLTGNNDMHLKNFSLLENSRGEMRLSPAYDLLNAAIANPADTEELALTLNGKRSNINKSDFVAAADNLGIPEKVVANMLDKYQKLVPKMEGIVSQSFLDSTRQQEYIALLRERITKITQ